MAILNEISVGDVFYYVVDSEPMHIAPKGSVAIKRNGFENRMYINNDGNNTWLKCISPEYGEMFFVNNTTLRDTTQNTWTSIANITSTAGHLNGFNVTSNQLVYTGSSTIKAFVTSSLTIRGGTTRWMDYEAATSRNNIVPPIYQGGTSIDNANWVKINSNRIVDISNGVTHIGAVRWIAREGGGNANDRSYAPRNFNLTINKIDDADTTFLETWESNNFSTNNWTLVNSTTNVWVLGTAENNTTGGQYAAYISNNDGTTASYTITTANVSHLYRDFEIPNINGDVILIFDWKCWGENAAGATQYDYGSVVMTDTTTTPVANTEVTTTLATLVNTRPTGNGRIGAITNGGKFNLNYGGADNNWRTEIINLSNYKGQTKRIVFTWTNDASVGNQPPFVIDNITLKTF